MRQTILIPQPSSSFSVLIYCSDSGSNGNYFVLDIGKPGCGYQGLKVWLGTCSASDRFRIVYVTRGFGMPNVIKKLKSRYSIKLTGTIGYRIEEKSHSYDKLRLVEKIVAIYGGAQPKSVCKRLDSLLMSEFYYRLQCSQAGLDCLKKMLESCKGDPVENRRQLAAE